MRGVSVDGVVCSGPLHISLPRHNGLSAIKSRRSLHDPKLFSRSEVCGSKRLRMEEKVAETKTAEVQHGIFHVSGGERRVIKHSCVLKEIMQRAERLRLG